MTTKLVVTIRDLDMTAPDQPGGPVVEEVALDEGELADWQARRDAPPGPAETNAPLLARLAEIDRKSIRALREGDGARIADLEAEAQSLRAQMVR